MFEFNVKPDTAPGRVYEYPEKLDDDGKPVPALFDGKPVRARIRSIPEPKILEINVRNWGRKRDVTWTKEGARGQVDPEAKARADIEKAVFALVDTENWPILPANEESVQALTKMGIPAEAGKPAFLDGHWTKDVREWFFGIHLSFAAWVAERGENGTAEEAAKEAEGKDN